MCGDLLVLVEKGFVNRMCDDCFCPRYAFADKSLFWIDEVSRLDDAPSRRKYNKLSEDGWISIVSTIEGFLYLNYLDLMYLEFADRKRRIISIRSKKDRFVIKLVLVDWSITLSQFEKYHRSTVEFVDKKLSEIRDPYDTSKRTTYIYFVKTASRSLYDYAKREKGIIVVETDFIIGEIFAALYYIFKKFGIDTRYEYYLKRYKRYPDAPRIRYADVDLKLVRNGRTIKKRITLRWRTEWWKCPVRVYVNIPRTYAWGRAKYDPIKNIIVNGSIVYDLNHLDIRTLRMIDWFIYGGVLKSIRSENPGLGDIALGHLGLEFYCTVYPNRRPCFHNLIPSGGWLEDLWVVKVYDGPSMDYWSQTRGFYIVLRFKEGYKRLVLRKDYRFVVEETGEDASRFMKKLIKVLFRKGCLTEETYKEHMKRVKRFKMREGFLSESTIPGDGMIEEIESFVSRIQEQCLPKISFYEVINERLGDEEEEQRHTREETNRRPLPRRRYYLEKPPPPIYDDLPDEVKEWCEKPLGEELSMSEAIDCIVHHHYRPPNNDYELLERIYEEYES